jgi:hypothetical protein
MTMRSSQRQRSGACLVLGLVLALVTSASGQSDPLCPHLVDCEYEAPAFSIRVFDQETGQPLANVHALASWLVYGGHGGRTPLVVLEAVSAADGTISFPAWGPIRSGAAGIYPARDPVISLFRPGYRALLVFNHSPVGQRHTVRVHAFQQAGSRYELSPLLGTPAEIVAGLREATNAFDGSTLSQHHPSSGRRAFVNRLRLVRKEAERLPRTVVGLEDFLWALNGDTQLLQQE